MNKKTFKTKKSIINVIAHCADCIWCDKNHHSAEKNAKEHAEKTGHEIIVETTTVYCYNPKKTQSEDFYIIRDTGIIYSSWEIENL
jgi:hypothetical protein